MAEAARRADGKPLYKHKEETWFGDGREERLLQYVRSKYQPKEEGKVHGVLRLIDEFGATQNYMMNVGAEKGGIVTDLIEEHKPQIMIELGSYIGYSTLLFADALRRNGGTQYISFERDPKFAAIVQAFVDLVGLDRVVKIVVGPSSESLMAEQAAGRLKTVDMIFLDHYKPAYVVDTKICESLGIIHQGTVLVADNVILPGNPPYLEYVRSTPEQKQHMLAGKTGSQPAHFPERTVNQYQEHDHEADTVRLPGRADIVYTSRLIQSHEPTGERDGLEITICTSNPVKR